MSPSLHTGLAVGICTVLAAWMGGEIAQAEYMWPALFGIFCLGALIARLTKLRADIVLLGMIVVGYLVGNRGFAQLMPAPSVPLLPAEAGLLVAGVWLMVSCALRGRLPFRQDPLNIALLAWMALGVVRVAFDLQNHGLLAVRDFATVYYAGFFFIAQDIARDEAARRYLHGALRTGIIVLLPMSWLYLVAQNFFHSYLTIRGMPLIFYKGDLVFTFLMVGAVLLFHWGQEQKRRWTAPLALVMFLAVMASESRASLAGGVVAIILLGLKKRWHFATMQVAATGAAFLVIVALAEIGGNDWAERRVEMALDRALSMVDVTGSMTYRHEESTSKGDNNQFRLVWWTNVVRETWSTNPAFGLGFGADLAGGFLREYYPELGDEFTARSPHNIIVTIFGRMGLVGLAIWGLLCVSILRATLRTLARGDAHQQWGLAVAPWVVLTSGCFGVVLEGPMAAVPFWILLGLFNHEYQAGERSVRDSLAGAPALPVKEAIELQIGKVG